MITEYRHSFRRDGDIIRTTWTTNQEQSLERISKRIGYGIHECGVVAGDGNGNPDGSHPGCPRNGGLLSRETRTR